MNNYDILNIDYFHQFSKGGNIKVAVLDSEIDLNHSEFKDKSIHYEEFIESMNPNYHGTAVTSLIAGNTIGIAPEVEIYHMKILSDVYGSGYSWDKAMSSALRQKVDIICMSIGTRDKLSPTMKQMLQTASDRGVIISAPSGNEGRTLLRNPADNDNVIAVGGVTVEGKLAKKSNRDKRIEGNAPSEDIVVAYGESGISGYTKKDGTSFANAIFVGQMALILSYVKANNKEINLREFLKMYNQKNRADRKVLDMKKVKKELDIYLDM